MGEVFTLIVPQKKIISSFNNQLDLVVMLELGVRIFFYCQSKAKPRVLMCQYIYCNFMLLDYVRIGRGDILFFLLPKQSQATCTDVSIYIL